MVSKTNYYKNITTLIFGSGIAHIIPFLFTPILTRLYSTAEYGIFSFFTSLLAISTIISTGKYHLAILLAEDEKESNSIKYISLILSICFFGLSLFSLYLLFEFRIFENLFIRTENLIFLLPMATLFFSLFDIINYVLNREQNYNKMSLVRIFRSIGREFSSLILGIYSWGAKGLILGSILGNLIPVAIYRKKIFKNLNSDKENRNFILKKHKDFPLYQMPTSILGSFSTQAPIYFFTVFYSLNVVGLFSLALRLFSIPISLITTSISQVFFKEISDLYSDKDYLGVKYIFNVTLKKLILIGFPISIFLFLFSEIIFYYIFGDQWAMTGVYVKYLVPAFFIKFIVSPLTPIFLVKKQIKILSSWKLLQFISTIITLFLCCSLINIEFINTTIIIYSIHEVILYTICFILQLRVLKY